MRILTRLLVTAFLSVFLTSIVVCSFAQTIKGKVFDAATGEPLAGANVHLENTHYSTIVNIDGSYVFKKVNPGKYEIEVSQLGYKKPEDIKTEVAAGGTATADFALKAEDNKLTEVVVIGNDGKSTDNNARRMEKNADVVQNILSEKAIQLLPDVTVANALQRISGVTIQRDNTGEGRYAIIRGMDQRYNNTLVNGIKIPSPDDKFRFVPMDMFPSEMLQRLEVIKALSPNMEADAIGGTMNLVMKDAPDKFLLSANVSAGYSTIFSSRPFSAFPHSGINKKSPAELFGNDYASNAMSDFTKSQLHYSNASAPINTTLGFTVGNRFLEKKLGFILSVSYQDFYKGSTSERLVPDAQPLPADNANILNFSDSWVREYNTHTNRVGLQNKFDYVFNSRNKISLFNMYLHQNDFESRFTPDTTVGLNSSATQSQLQVENRSTWQIQNIYNATLHGEHELSSKVKLDWDGVYSIAKKEMPDQSFYQFNVKVTKDAGGKIESVDSTISTGSNTVNHVWQHNTDKDLAGYLNLSYKPVLFNRVVEFTTGGLYRYKTRTNYYNEYKQQVDTSSGVPFTSVDALPLKFGTTDDSKGSTTAINPNTYTAHEKITAGYIQARFTVFPKLQVLGGVRIENTQQDYATVMPVQYNYAFGDIHYTDVLPSVHFKYLLSDKQNLRLSYFKSISRPGFGEIDPYNRPGESYTEIGNPLLLHTRADNVDLRYELFPHLADQFLVGAFYKQLQNPIEYFVTRNGSPSTNYIQPQNTDKATNFGGEVVFTKFFGMFGVSANYTYTHSSITTNKLLYHSVQGSYQTDVVSQTRPLQGQANNVGNLSLLYKNPKIGFDVQAAWVYTGDRIAQVSQYYNLDIWQKPFSQLDVSLEKSITKHFSFYAKVNNLTNSTSKYYVKTPYSVVNSNFHGTYFIPFQDAGSNYTVTQKDMFKLSFLGGFHFKF
jgi:hypothetical protein